MHYMVADDADHEGKPNFEVQDDGIIDFMHNITIMTFPDMSSSESTRRQGRLYHFAT
jgi:hypothetical protein